MEITLNDVFRLCLKMEYTPSDETVIAGCSCFQRSMSDLTETADETTKNVIETLKLLLETWRDHDAF